MRKLTLISRVLLLLLVPLPLSAEAFSLTQPETQSPRVPLETLKQIQQAALGEVDPRLLVFGCKGKNEVGFTARAH